jgi:exodeoxyribonuclease V alpha subunit
MEEIAYHIDEKLRKHVEQTGIEAKTIHRLLEADPKNGGFKCDAENPLDCDLFVVDETRANLNCPKPSAAVRAAA